MSGLKSGIPVTTGIRERLEEVEEEGNPMERPAASTNLDPGDLSDTVPPTRRHILAGLRAFGHIYSRGLPDPASVRGDALSP
jgi:hypothetical protein